MLSGALGCVGVVVAVEGLVVYFWPEKASSMIGRSDSATFDKESQVWERVIRARSGSVRSQKRFANRMRLVLADRKLEGMVRQIMGIGTLVEVGEISGLEEQWGAAEFSKWKEDEWTKLDNGRIRVEQELGESGEELIEEWIECTWGVHWEIYRDVVKRGGI